MISSPRLRMLVAAMGVTTMLGMGAVPALAQQGVTPPGGTSQSQTLGGALSGGLNTAVPPALKGASDIRVVVASIINSLIGVLGMLLFFYMLYGGYTWMTAQGDSKKVDTAKGIIRDAIIGLVIIAASYAIATFVINSLSVATGGQPTIPQ